MLKRISTGLAAMMFSVTAFAQLDTFIGVDEGAVPGGPRPNSDAAYADFVAAFPAGVINLDDFESYAVGSLPVVMKNSVTLSCVNASNSPPYFVGIDDKAGTFTGWAESNIFGFNTTAGGDNRFAMLSEVASPEACTFTFGLPVQAFGAYFTGVGTRTSKVTLNFTDGSTQEVTVPGAEDGGATFAGFTNPGKFIVSVSVLSTNVGDAISIDDLTTVESTDTARFKVTKTFTPATVTETVDVSISCNNGQPSADTATITGGDPVGHTFVISGLEQNTGVTCTIRESGPRGFDSAPFQCRYTDVIARDYTCHFTNTAQDVTFGFTKIWDTTGAGDGGIVTERTAQLRIDCNVEITSFSPESGDALNEDRAVTWSSSSNNAEVEYLVELDATGETPECYVSERGFDSAVESTRDGRCGNRLFPVTIPIGRSVTSCEITNTVFFEGIPTLSQYGLAIMALLMLGMGFVGLRRFV